MTKLENSSTDEKNVEAKALEQIAVDKQLIPRLKFMGLLLLSFSVCTLVYSIFFASDIPVDSNQNFAVEGIYIPQEVKSPGFFQVERYNGYTVTFCFALVGGLCFIAALNKQKKAATKPEEK